MPASARRGNGGPLPFSQPPTFEHITIEDGLSYNQTLSLLQDRLGFIWVGTRFGLNKFDGSDFTIYAYDRDNPNGLNANGVWSLYEDRSGNLWISTWGGGVDRFDPLTETFIHFRHNENVPGSLSSNLVWSVFQDSRGTIWVGTEDGLNKYQPATNMFATYRAKDGLAGDLVAGILEDNRGNLWISTNRGLSRFDPQAETFRNYDAADGLQSNQFWVRAAYKSNSGELFFGGVRGFNAFFPHQLVDNPYIPPVVLTDFLLFNQPVGIGGDSPLPVHINFAKEIVLSHNQSVITFKFAALNYRSPAKNQYAYMLEGFDKTWTHVDSTRRRATYTNLAPGTYIFRVKASNNDGVWNETGTAVRLIITPAWWQTWWFYALCAAVVLGIFGVLYQAKAGQVQAEKRLSEILQESNERLEIKVQERTAELLAVNKELEAFSYSVSHDLRAPLRAIDGFSQILLEEYNHKLDAEGVRYLQNVRSSAVYMGQLIDDLLRLSRVTRAEIRHETVNLSRLAEQTAATLQNSQPDRQVEFIIHPNLIVQGDPSLLQVVMQNLLDNAWKFSSRHPAARIEFGVEEIDGVKTFFVQDDGAGFDMAYSDKLFGTFQRLHHPDEFPGTGIGLATVQRIIHRYGGRIWATGAVEQGATFYFTL